MGGRSMGGRLRWLAVFTSVLLASTAVPVFAESEPAAGQSGGEEAPQPPDPLAVQAALEESEQEEADREEWLRGAEAERARADSRLAFADLNEAQIKDLLRDHFGRQLSFLNRDDPARVLSDAVIRDVYAGEGATLELEDQELLLDGSFPTHTEDKDGELRKVDLDLEATAEGFEAKNPLTDLTIADSAQGQIELGEEVAISALGSDNSPAQRFGEKDILYPEVHEDSDRLVAPVGAGVEIFDLLRSEESPETLRYSLTLPEAATLRPAGEGAEVVRGEEILMRVRPPVATDAQGTEVPVEMKVEGDSLALNVSHRKMDIAYPLLVDPYFEWEITEDWYFENWYNGYHTSDLYQWDWYTNSSWIYGQTYTINYDFGGSGRGLHVSSRPGDFGPGKWGHWAYDLPNLNAYVEAISVLPFKYQNHECQKYYHQQPDDYVGLWDNVNDKWIRLVYNDSYYKGWSNVGFSFEYPGWGHMAMIGLSMGSGPDIPCWRDFYAGGVLLYLSDWADPQINGFSGISNDWIGPNTPVTVTANAYDAGLGVREVAFNPQDTATLVDHVGCSGLAGDRCPTSYGAQRTFTGKSLDEGKKWVRATATDALGRGSEAEVEYTKVDRSEPKLTLSGQLAQATDEVGSSEKPAGEGDELVLPVYRLQIDATDGSNSEAKLMRSGVKDIRVYLDGEEQEVPWEPNPSPCDSCPMNVIFELKLHDVSPGEHTLEVDAEDHVGLKRERNIEFEYFPATGMKDEYVMHYFPLPDGEGDEEEEEHPRRPELAVNVMNGNLVYREQDIDVEGPAVDLEVERYYNSMLPEEESTEWGEGWTLAQAPDLEPEGAEGPPAEGRLRDRSGALDEGVGLPTTMGAESFDPELQATITKEAGGYELTDETGESATSTVFDASGRVTQLRTGEDNPEEATVNYSYEGSALSGIAVDDPGSAGSPTEEPEEEAPQASGEAPIFSFAFGSSGSANGQLNTPADLAVDAQGRIWVVDKSNNRVQKFDAEGNFLSKFGSYGTANGQFNRPAAIAIDDAGEIWVTDANNNRVQKFSAEGDFLAKFGSAGSGNGQFSGPEGIAIDAQGNLWVADTYNGRVQQFNAQGEFLQVVGSKGSGEGQIGEATGIDVDSAGNVWIADWQNNRVSVFDSQGEFLDQFGSAGTGDGQFNRPDALDIDTQGNVWVGDQNNDRIQRFDLAGQYVDQFGAPGSGEAQFNFTWPMGLTADDQGHVWVSDNLNHRVQKWTIPNAEEEALEISHAGAFGEAGSEAGQLEAPSDVAAGPAGDLWVADTGNDRIQRFDSEGELISQFGVTGAEDGQLSEPTGIAIDAEGDLWVVDRGNSRVQRFDPAGEFLSKFGESGFESGKLLSPREVEIDAAGNLWVVDALKLQKFSPGGEFLERVGQGQISFPTGMDIGPEGTIWVASQSQDSVFAFSEEGALLGQFGSTGSGEGQFEVPIDVAVDSQGHIWVADSETARVQMFDSDGTYIAQFAETGAGEEQLNLANPSGIAADGGSLWIADRGNDRIQQWVGFAYSHSEEEPAEDDPRVQVESSEGLISAVSGEEAGSHTYAHEGELLTAHEGPQGETSYEYDDEGNLTKVTLPNGTWGEVEYDNTYGRVKSVTVDPAGEDPAVTTQFYFTDAPERRTKVVPSNAPYTVYEIGEDGSVLKWWNTEEPPTFLLAGTLADVTDPSEPLSYGDQTLEVQAFSPEGIDTIEIIAEGDTLVQEKTCEPQNEETAIEECEDEITEWVTHTDLHSPGRLDLEVIVTDRIGNSSSERFWVTIPKPPPPPPAGAQVPPKFHDILKFREEYGLEVVFPVENELELHDRIFNLIGAWYNPHSPEGKVARASMARWGVPLRPQDVAELEYREWLYDVNAEKIDQWVEATSPGSYAGYYLDHAAGGIMHIGFTNDQDDRLEDLKSLLSLVAEGRLQVYATTPSVSYLSVRATTQSVMSAIESNSTLADLIVSVEDDEAGRATRIGTPNVSQVEGILDQMVGANAPVEVEYEAGGGALLEGRYRNKGRMRAGDYINGTGYVPLTGGATGKNKVCTAGFGAEDRRPRPNGGEIVRLFLLTAGHCYWEIDQEVWRAPQDESQGFADAGKSEVGRLKRNALHYAEIGGVRTDGAAIRIKQGGIVPRAIWGWEGNALPTKPARKARKRNVVCYSGAVSKNVACGKIVARSTRWTGIGGGIALGGYWVRFPEDDRPVEGDSGSPVWSRRTGGSIGLVSAGRPPGTFEETLVAPLLHPPNMESWQVPGILHHLGMEPLRLKLGG